MIFLVISITFSSKFRQPIRNKNTDSDHEVKQDKIGGGVIKETNQTGCSGGFSSFSAEYEKIKKTPTTSIGLLGYPPSDFSGLNLDIPILKPYYEYFATSMAYAYSNMRNFDVITTLQGPIISEFSGPNVKLTIELNTTERVNPILISYASNITIKVERLGKNSKSYTTAIAFPINANSISLNAPSDITGRWVEKDSNEIIYMAGHGEVVVSCLSTIYDFKDAKKIFVLDVEGVKSNVGVIVGVVVGVILVIGVIVGVVYYFKYYRKRQDSTGFRQETA